MNVCEKVWNWSHLKWHIVMLSKWWKNKNFWVNFPFTHEIHCSLVWIWQELSQSFRTHQHASIYTYALTYDEMGSSDFIPSIALLLKCVESYSACAFFLYITETAIRFNSQSLAHLHNGVKRFDLKQLNRNCWVEGFLIECVFCHIYLSFSFSDYSFRT